MPLTAIHIFQKASGQVPFQDWLDELERREPRAYAKCLERVLRLSQIGFEMRRPHADSLRDGIHELRAKAGNVNYRPLYFFCGQNRAVISHGITKEGKVPDAEIEIAVKNKVLVERDFNKYTTEFDL